LLHLLRHLALSSFHTCNNSINFFIALHLTKFAKRILSSASSSAASSHTPHQLSSLTVSSASSAGHADSLSFQALGNNIAKHCSVTSAVKWARGGNGGSGASAISLETIENAIGCRFCQFHPQLAVWWHWWHTWLSSTFLVIVIFSFILSFIFSFKAFPVRI